MTKKPFALNISISGLLLELSLRSWHFNIPHKSFLKLLEKAYLYNIEYFEIPTDRCLNIKERPQELFLCENLSTYDILNVLEIWKNGFNAQNVNELILDSIRIFFSNNLPVKGFLVCLTDIFIALENVTSVYGLVEDASVNDKYNNSLRHILNVIDKSILSTNFLRYEAAKLFWIIFQHDLLENQMIPFQLAGFLLDIILHNNYFDFLINSESLRTWMLDKLPKNELHIVDQFEWVRNQNNQNFLEQSFKENNEDAFEADKLSPVKYSNYQKQYTSQNELFSLKLYSIFMHRINIRQNIEAVCNTYDIKCVYPLTPEKESNNMSGSSTAKSIKCDVKNQTEINSRIMLQEEISNLSISKSSSHEILEDKSKSEKCFKVNISKIEYFKLFPLKLDSTCEFIVNLTTLKTYSIRVIKTNEGDLPLSITNLPMDHLKYYRSSEDVYIHPYSLRRFNLLNLGPGIFDSPNDCLSTITQLFCICQESQLLNCSDNWLNFYEENDRYLPRKNENQYKSHHKKFEVTYRNELQSKPSERSLLSKNEIYKAYSLCEKIYLSHDIIRFKNQIIAYDIYGAPYSIQFCKNPHKLHKVASKLPFSLWNACNLEQYAAFDDNYAKSMSNPYRWLKWKKLINDEEISLKVERQTIFGNFFKKCFDINLSKRSTQKYQKCLDLSTYIDINKNCIYNEEADCIYNVVKETSKNIRKLNKQIDEEVRKQFSDFPTINTQCILLIDLFSNQLAVAQIIETPNNATNYFYSYKDIQHAINSYKTNNAVFDLSVNTKIPLCNPGDYSKLNLPKKDLRYSKSCRTESFFIEEDEDTNLTVSI